MTTIRPDAFPISPPQTAASQGASAARSAAQRAFFDAALGRSGAPAAPQATRGAQAAQTIQAAQAAAPAPVQRAELRPATAPTEPPARILRPGSLLDIRV